MYQLVLCTCPDQACAEALAKQLVTAKLAACVNIVPAVRSVYLWQGQLETADEYLLLIKTRQDCYHDLESLLHQLHPYDVPEIVALDIREGSTDYLQWMDSCLSRE